MHIPLHLPTLLLLALMGLSSFSSAQLEQDKAEAALARRVAMYLELDALDEPSDTEVERKHKLDEAIGELLDKLLDDPSEAGADALIERVLTEHAPESLPLFEAHREDSAGGDIDSRLRTIVTALEFYAMAHEGYPVGPRGLEQLTQGELPILAPQALSDPWGKALRYCCEDEFAYEVRSAGPDGIFDNADDPWVDEQGELRLGAAPDETGATAADVATDTGPLYRAPLATSSTGEPLLGSLSSSAKIWSLDLHADGHGVAYVGQRDDGVYAGFGDLERGPFDSLTRVAVGDVPGAVAYKGLRGETEYLVTRGREIELNGSLAFAYFVQGTQRPCFAAARADGAEAWIGQRSLRFDGTELQVGEVGPVVVNSDQIVIAYRERRADGYVLHLGPRMVGPFEWIAQPRLKLVDDHHSLSYRTWDGSETTVVIDGRESHCDWARGEVASNDGRHSAYVEIVGGEPVADFESLREVQETELREQFYVSMPAFQGGRARVVIDGQPSPLYARVEEPVFAANGGSVAFRAQDELGYWRVIHYVDGRFSQYPPCDDVSRPVLDLDGIVAAYTATLGDSRLLCFNEDSGEFTGDVLFDPGPEGHIAFVLGDENGFGFGVHSPEARGQTVGPFDGVTLGGFLPGTNLTYAIVTNDGQTSIMAPSGTNTPFSYWTSELVVSKKGRIGYFAQGAEGYHPLILDLVTNELLQPDDTPFVAVTGPRVNDAGDIAFVVSRDGEVFTDWDGAPLSFDGKAEVLTFDGAWSYAGPHDSVADLRGGPGSFVYQVDQGERTSVAWLIDGEQRIGASQAAIGELVQTTEGRPVYVADNGDREHVVAGREKSAEYLSAGRLSFAPGTDRPVFLGVGLTGVRWVVDWIEGPEFTYLKENLFWNEAGDHVAYLGNDGGEVFSDFTVGGSNTLVVTPLDDPASSLTFEADFISSPVFTEDGRVQAALVRGLEIVRLDVEL